MPAAETIKVFTFNLKTEISEKEALEKLCKLDAIVRECEGFVGRELSQNKEGRWMDALFWKDPDSAKTATKRVMQDPKAMEAFSVIDRSTLSMNHYQIEKSF